MRITDEVGCSSGIIGVWGLETIFPVAQIPMRSGLFCQGFEKFLGKAAYCPTRDAPEAQSSLDETLEYIA